MKNVLIVYFSQSGQLKSIAKNIAKPLLEDNEINVVFHEIRLVKPFPFPWDKDAFFDVFPESFLRIPTELEPVAPEVLNIQYDLVLLHYQVWYLTPSIPINSFLNSPEARILLDGTPIVTVSGSRNMWIMAQEKVKNLLKENNANLKGNIALVDRVGNLISVITIVEWMFSGVKKKYLGLFPLPGVSEKDIIESAKFGKIILSDLKAGDFNNLQSKLVANDGVRISPFLVLTDKTGNKIFSKWAHFIVNKKKSRKIWLKAFYVYLFLAIWLISPIVYILHVITFPLKINKIKKETQYYQGV